jgi:hypothetical protein
MITNTSKQPDPGWTGGRNPNAIQAQEKQGQRELTSQTSQLPVKGFFDLPKEWGIEKIGDAIHGSDPLFHQVKLPDGWTIIATDHDMWSDLVDADGNKKAEIFYKLRITIGMRSFVSHKTRVKNRIFQSTALARVAWHGSTLCRVRTPMALL